MLDLAHSFVVIHSRYGTGVHPVRWQSFQAPRNNTISGIYLSSQHRITEERQTSSNPESAVIILHMFRWNRDIIICTPYCFLVVECGELFRVDSIGSLLLATLPPWNERRHSQTLQRHKQLSDSDSWHGGYAASRWDNS